MANSEEVMLWRCFTFSSCPSVYVPLAEWLFSVVCEFWCKW